MTLEEKYHFSDFTHGHFSECIDLAKRKFRFIGYDEIEDSDRFILWRHDVDFSMHMAAKLAEIEASKGIKATYFVYPHSEFYNLFEKEIFELVKTIQNFGHDLGLHFDSHFYEMTSIEDLEAALNREKQLLETYFQTHVKVFSFHNNNDFTMSCEEWSYSGMINTYAKRFKQEIGYCSDTQGIWRFSRLFDLLESNQYKNLQVLTHPEWWQEKAMAPRQRIKRCIEGRATNNLRYYDELLLNNNRLNIDAIEA